MVHERPRDKNKAFPMVEPLDQVFRLVRRWVGSWIIDQRHVSRRGSIVDFCSNNSC